MSKLDEFYRHRRSWYIELAFEFVSIIAFFAVYFTGGESRDMIFWLFMFIWSKLDADIAYKKIMALKP